VIKPACVVALIEIYNLHGCLTEWSRKEWSRKEWSGRNGLDQEWSQKEWSIVLMVSERMVLKNQKSRR
jgi:hypothetical protein